MMRQFLVLVGCLVMACSDDEPDLERPVIDPAPYYQTCGALSAACPSPYECTTETTWHGTGPQDVCMVPCAADVDCPVGFFCMGVTQSSDVGADDHCIMDV